MGMKLILINFALGWVGAVLVNYLADVLPVYRKLTIFQCTNCSEKLLGEYYILLRPCEKCQTKPTARHIIVAMLVPILAVLVAIFPIANLGNFGGIIWLVFFGVVTVIDLEHRLILHTVSIVGAGLGLIFGIMNHGFIDTLIGGGAGFGIMLAFYFLGELFVNYLARKRGEEIDEVALGFGDVNLAGVIGLLLGWPGIIAGLFLAIFLGGVVSGIFLLFKAIRGEYQALTALPYGPFLVLSAAALFYISDLIR